MSSKRFRKPKTAKRQPRRTKQRRGRKDKEIVIYKSPSSVPFPPRFRTTFTIALTGSITAADAVSSGFYFVSLNGPYLPLAGGQWPHPLGATLAANQPTGFAQLCNATTYTYGRCYGSSIEVEFLPQALTDTIECCVTPSFSNGTPTNTAQAMQAPYTKNMFMSSSKMNGRNGSAIKHRMSVHKLLGVTQSAVRNDLSGQLNFASTGDPTRQLFWVVNWAASDANNIVAACEYRLRVRYDCELFNQSSGITGYA